MRSFRVSLFALALSALLCACVSRVPVWETVDDALVCKSPERRPSTIVFAVPDGAVAGAFSQDGLTRLYTAQDDAYEISTTVFKTADAKAAVRSLSGFPADQLEIIKTTRFSLPEYQFAWSAETGEGERLYRAALLCDEAYCYALCFSAPAGAGTSYDSIQEMVFASFGLYFDETL